MPSNENNSNELNDGDNGFQFSPNIVEVDDSEATEFIEDLSKKDKNRLFDLVKLEPTNNSELKSKWEMNSGRELYQYMESYLSPYYYRDDDNYIYVKEEVKDFIFENKYVDKYVTKERDNSRKSMDVRNRDLLIELITITEKIGHLPREIEIEEHSEYSPDKFCQEFGSLFSACKEAGIVPDSVTKSDYMQATESQEGEELEQGEVNHSKPSLDELIEELQLVDNKIERIPYPSDMDEQGAYSVDTYQEEFGSWNDALDAAEIDKEEEILEDMERVAEEVGLDMTQSDMNEYGLYSSKMAARCFGNWNAAKEQFKQWTSLEEDEEESEADFDEMVNDRLDDILG